MGPLPGSSHANLCLFLTRSLTLWKCLCFPLPGFQFPSQNTFRECYLLNTDASPVKLQLDSPKLLGCSFAWVTFILEIPSRIFRVESPAYLMQRRSGYILSEFFFLNLKTANHFSIPASILPFTSQMDNRAPQWWAFYWCSVPRLGKSLLLKTEHGLEPHCIPPPMTLA